jgi:hypothetical protein
MTLKDAVTRRDAVMAFVAKGDKLKVELKRERGEIARERESFAREKESFVAEKESFVAEKEVFAREVDALEEILREAKRPEQEFEELRKKYDDLCQEMERHREVQLLEATNAETAIEILRKELKDEKEQHQLSTKIANSAIADISELTKANEKLSSEIHSLKARYALECKQHELTKAEYESVKKVHQIALNEKRELLQKNERLLIEYENSEKEKLAIKNQNQLLTIQNQELSRKTFNAENKAARLQVEKDVLESRYQKLIDEGTESAFAINDLDLVHALSSHVLKQFTPPRKIVTIGEGPYDEGEFDDYLRLLSIEPYESGFPWIIVGREGWTEEQIDELIENSDLDEVRVFSQELFVAGILTTHDPFSLPIEMLKKFAEGHPALEYLMDSGFEWPEINPEEDYGVPVYLKGSMERVDKSPLAELGYKVGITRGEHVSYRRVILKSAYHNELPEVEDEDYMEEWGRPRHSKRLWRMAHHIAWLIRSRQSNPSMSYAVSDWQEDLDWLEQEFYTNRMRFKWPDV